VSKQSETFNKIRANQNKNPRAALMGGIPDSKENVNVNKNDNVNVDVNKNDNDNVNVNNNVDVNVNNDFLNDLVKEKPKKKSDSLTNSGIYFEEEVYKILMGLAKKGGRGAKSKIVNDALKVAFKNAGLMN
jgi:hypothetical protein